MIRTQESAYAKINLCLDVTSRRADGYHIIDGVMQSVTLCDQLEIGFEAAEETGIILHAQGNPDIPTDGKNLAVRAAQRFLETAHLTGRVEIDLQKKIPMAGGLAGGSTDAAAVLRGLNRLTGSPLSMKELCAVGVTIGADVPFCIRGGAMRTQGIGDLLTPCKSMPACHIVITRRGAGVSTPWAYGRLDGLYHSFAPGAARPDSHLSALLGALETGSLEQICANVYNLFEPVVSECQQDVPVLRDHLLAGGAVAARMSGSGPCVFGVFEDPEKAESAVRSLTGIGAEAFLCQPMEREFF